MGEVAGLSVHADISVQTPDHERLNERCRYVARPPVATEHLSFRLEGRERYALRHRFREEGACGF